MIRSKAFDVFRIAGRDKRALKLKGGGNDECVDRVSGRHAGSGEEGACALSDRSSQVDDPNDVAIQELVQGSIHASAATDFGEDRRRNADERSTLMGDPCNSACSQGEGASLRWIGQCINGFRVKDQRFGQARLARRRAASGTGPKVSSSSPRN